MAKIPKINPGISGPPIHRVTTWIRYTGFGTDLISYDRPLQAASYLRDLETLPRYGFFCVVPFTVSSSQYINIRMGQLISVELAAWVPPAFQRFPYFEQRANPPVPIRYGRDILEGPQAFVPPNYQRFPFVPGAAANPGIPYRLGQPLASEAPANVPSQYLAFPYFEQPANPPIGRREGRPTTEEPQAWVIPKSQQFILYPRVSKPIEMRYGQDVKFEPAAFVRPQFGVFPYFKANAAPVILFCVGQFVSDQIAPVVGRTEFQRFVRFVVSADVNVALTMALGHATIEYFIEDELGNPILQEDGLEYFLAEAASALGLINTGRGGFYHPTFRPRRGR